MSSPSAHQSENASAAAASYTLPYWWASLRLKSGEFISFLWSPKGARCFSLIAGKKSVHYDFLEYVLAHDERELIPVLELIARLDDHWQEGRNIQRASWAAIASHWGLTFRDPDPVTGGPPRP